MNRPCDTVQPRGATGMTTKDLVLQVLDQLPDDAGIDEVMERLSFVWKLQQRLDHTEMVEKFTQQEAQRRMRRWLK